jgi:hypothetical protein
MAMAGDDVQQLHVFRQFYQELRIAFQVMDPGGILPGEARHRLDALPAGNGHELAFLGPVLTRLPLGRSWLDRIAVIRKRWRIENGRCDDSR